MADSSSEESENEFPELPPNVMLNIGLGSENSSDGRVSLTVISDETREEDCLPDVVDADDTSSSSSASESDKGEIASNILNGDSIVQDRYPEHEHIIAGVKIQLEDRDEKVNFSVTSLIFFCVSCLQTKWASPFIEFGLYFLEHKTKWFLGFFCANFHQLGNISL